VHDHVSFQKPAQTFEPDGHLIQHNGTCGSSTAAQAAK